LSIYFGSDETHHTIRKLVTDVTKPSEGRFRAQQAKEFLISQIAEQAHKGKMPLSEIERKMLYFTEAEETLPDVYEVNEQFDREYDASVYEKKIAGLLRDAHRRILKESPDGESRWNQAIADLRKEDHYLRVIVDQSLQPASEFLVVAKGSIVLVLAILAFVALHDYAENKGWVPHQIYLGFWILAAFMLWLALEICREMIRDAIEARARGARSASSASKKRKHRV
jgi:hypothetical protein